MESQWEDREGRKTIDERVATPSQGEGVSNGSIRNRAGAQELWLQRRNEHFAIPGFPGFRALTCAGGLRSIAEG